MNGAEQDQQPVFPMEEDLLQLQLRIARRADELAQSWKSERSPDTDWRCWLDAEREVLKSCSEASAAAAL